MNIKFAFYCFIAIILTSCLGIVPTSEVRKIDALNDKAIYYRYISLDSIAEYAGLAYKEVQLYDLGKAEAANSLGFYRFMIMDFERALNYFKEIPSYTNNELELLVADIGRMKIYQRTARSKQFYDARNSALARMKRINEDRSVFDKPRDQKRLHFAYTEFYIVSVIFFYYLEQDDAARRSLQDLDTYRKSFPSNSLDFVDINQYLYSQYIKAATGLVRGNTHAQKVLNSFDVLYQTWSIARENKIVYFEANAAQGMADLLVRPSNYDLIKKERTHILSTLGNLDTNLPLALAESALSLFETYKDVYQVSGTYVTIGKYYNYNQAYDEALSSLTSALELVNLHHRSYYSSHHTVPDNLVAYNEVDSEEFTEIEWIINDILTVPEWIARIREQLSVAYAGLDNKLASDYNRNIYLDILELVRQDKELESRYEALQQEELTINKLLILLLVLICILAGVFYWVNKRSRKKTKLYLLHLENSLQVCRDLTASLPQRNGGVESILYPIMQIIDTFLGETLGVERILIRIKLAEEDEVEVDSAPHLANDNQLRHFNFELNTKDTSRIGFFRVYTRAKLSKENITFISVLSPYIVWAIENGLNYMDLGEEREVLEKKLFITNQHNIQHKRENIIKRATMRIVFGIQPYLDRIRNEVHKIVYADYAQDKSIRDYKYQYIEELLNTIQEHNEVLALWIKIKQGELSLQITNFDLGELFELAQKGTRSFEQKGINFMVFPEEVYVKADRALTLFMINTLLENARKFTPGGGSVVLALEKHEDFVEIAIQDTGIGLSQDDIQQILTEKVYDSSRIGSEQAATKGQKGSGFGLMSCKSIIDKYRKSNAVFQVCDFNIESEVGKGSRFSFRLPYGVKKVLMLVLCFLGAIEFSMAQKDMNGSINMPKNLTILNSPEDLLQDASDCADAAYFSNKEHQYAQSLIYLEQAIKAINQYTQILNDSSGSLMTLEGINIPAEIKWWDASYSTNYNIILDIRNEAAVAFLALKNIDGYNYNNKAYTMLYKSLTKDDSLDRFCKMLERSTSNKRVVLILLLLLVAFALIIYYITYVRQRLLRRWSLEQVLDINQTIFSSSLAYAVNSLDNKTNEVDFTTVPQSILSTTFVKINELLTVEKLGLILLDKERQQLFTTTYPDNTILATDKITQCSEKQEWVIDGLAYYIPLEIHINDAVERIGVFYMERRETPAAEDEKLFMEMIARYLSTVLYNTMIRTAGRFRDINLVFDDINRLEWENNQIYVQNRVLDNCLSAIKHETIYYPSRLKQVVELLRTSNYTLKEEQAQVQSMYDLIEYYKGVFTILTLWAKRETEYATFRRTKLSIDELITSMDLYFKKKTKKRLNELRLEWNVEPNLEIVGDEKLVKYLLVLLLNDSLVQELSGQLIVTISTNGDFIEFVYSDSRWDFSHEELENLFYPRILSAMLERNHGQPRMTYLIAKEIIREHDEFVGRRGCRIRAYKEDGIKLSFTLPRTINNDKKEEL